MFHYGLPEALVVKVGWDGTNYTSYLLIVIGDQYIGVTEQKVFDDVTDKYNEQDFPRRRSDIEDSQQY